MAMDGIQVPRASGLDRYEVINPLELPRIECAELTSRGTSGIYVEGAGETRKFHRYGASFVDDPDQVGLFSRGIGVQPYWYAPAYTAGISDATLVGYRTIITPTKQFFTDEAYAEAESFQHRLSRISRSDSFSNEATGLRPTDRERYFEFDPGDRAHRHV